MPGVGALGTGTGGREGGVGGVISKISGGGESRDVGRRRRSSGEIIHVTTWHINYHYGSESSVHVATVMVLEKFHPIVIMLGGHVGQKKEGTYTLLALLLQYSYQ